MTPGGRFYWEIPFWEFLLVVISGYGFFKWARGDPEKRMLFVALFAIFWSGVALLGLMWWVFSRAL